MKPRTKFLYDSQKMAFDLNHRKTIKFNMSKYHNAVKNGNQNFTAKEKAREYTAFLKREVLANWSNYLGQFEENFQKKGGTVHWAENASDAIGSLKSILEKHKSTYVMKSKSMTTEEIHLNENLEKMGIEPIETDLGEYIVQLAGEKPYHILTPAMHKSKEDVAQLFHDQFDLPQDATPERITAFVREKLRKYFFDLKVGITGANFLISDTGSVALTENEGNGIMATAFPRVHIIIAGIEKLIPSLQNLEIFWPLLANAGTGQKLTVYNSIFTPNKKDDKEIHIILLDNGRTRVHEESPQWKALACIRCGACLNHCPIYHNIGGHAYNSVYSGPIGSVITPHMEKSDDYFHLSHACSLCGKCKEVCPVKIDLPELLLNNRTKSHKSIGEKQMMQIGSSILMQRNRMDFNVGSIKKTGLKLAGPYLWGNKKLFPTPSNKSFSEQYKNGHSC